MPRPRASSISHSGATAWAAESRLQSWRPSIAAMVLTGAGPGPVHYRWEEHFTTAELRQLAETGRIEQRSDLQAERASGHRRPDAARFRRVRSGGDSGACPLPGLLINGDGDAEERKLAEISQAALGFLPPGLAPCHHRRRRPWLLAPSRPRRGPGLGLAGAVSAVRSRSGALLNFRCRDGARYQNGFRSPCPDSRYRHSGESRDPGATHSAVCRSPLDSGFRRNDGRRNASSARRSEIGVAPLLQGI